MIAPPPALQHRRQEGADHPVHRAHVEAERFLPVFGRAVEERAVGHAPGAVEEHVRRAGLLRHGLHGVRVADVEGAAGDAVERREACELLRVDVGRPEPGAFALERDGGGVADPLPRRRDQRGLACEPVAHRSAPGEGGPALLDEGRDALGEVVACRAVRERLGLCLELLLQRGMAGGAEQALGVGVGAGRADSQAPGKRLGFLLQPVRRDDAVDDAEPLRSAARAPRRATSSSLEKTRNSGNSGPF